MGNIAALITAQLTKLSQNGGYNEPQHGVKSTHD